METIASGSDVGTQRLIHPIRALVKPAGAAGQITIPQIVDGYALGNTTFTTYRFIVLERLEGFSEHSV